MAEVALKNPRELASFETQFISGKIEGWTKLLEGAWSLKDRARSLQLTFVNLSGQDVYIEDTYFDSGTWYRSWPPVIGPGMIAQGTVANRQGSWFTGVTGGMRLKINGACFAYIGFNNPYIGGYKNYGELAWFWKYPRYGYDQSENNNPKLSINCGYKLTVQQIPSEIAQMDFLFTLQTA